MSQCIDPYKFISPFNPRIAFLEVILSLHKVLEQLMLIEIQSPLEQIVHLQFQIMLKHYALSLHILTFDWIVFEHIVVNVNETFILGPSCFHYSFHCLKHFNIRMHNYSQISIVIIEHLTHFEEIRTEKLVVGVNVGDQYLFQWMGFNQQRSSPVCLSVIVDPPGHIHQFIPEDLWMSLHFEVRSYIACHQHFWLYNLFHFSIIMAVQSKIVQLMIIPKKVSYCIFFLNLLPFNLNTIKINKAIFL